MFIIVSIVIIVIIIAIIMFNSKAKKEKSNNAMAKRLNKYRQLNSDLTKIPQIPLHLQLSDFENESNIAFLHSKMLDNSDRIYNPIDTQFLEDQNNAILNQDIGVREVKIKDRKARNTLDDFSDAILDSDSVNIDVETPYIEQKYTIADVNIAE